MTRFRFCLAVQFLLFLIPVNIYVVGDWLGAGVQWILVRYQQTYLGTSIIPVTKDITYLLHGTISGRSGIALGLWDFGTLLVITATILVISAYTSEDFSLVKKASLITIAGGILLAISDLIQYGIWLNGPSGFVIPLGIPFILIIGGWMYRMADEPDEGGDETGAEDTPESI
jgi:hypothetical protein